MLPLPLHAEIRPGLSVKSSREDVGVCNTLTGSYLIKPFLLPYLSVPPVPLFHQAKGDR